MESRDGKPEDDSPAVPVALADLAILQLSLGLGVQKLLVRG